ncbi:MAG: dTMP kinase [Gammaproteobacteria bacterium]|nr:dTMP kinase [Gammaproteobacteria bacterium]
MRGKFITVEGIDGAGKSSVTFALHSYLTSCGIDVFTTREPGGTELAEELREATLKHRKEKVLPITEVLMLFAGRAQLFNERIRPELERGTWVLSDRFSDSTIAYQGGGHGVSTKFLFDVANQVHGDLWPDRTYLLDVPIEEGLKRKSGLQLDRIEIQDADFFQRTRDEYLRMARKFERITLIDSSRSLDVVLKDIYADLETSLLSNV